MGEVPSNEKVCILLVDADPTSIANISELLSQANYKVLIASRGEDALNLLLEKQHDVHLVLTGMKLPDMCSFEFVQTVEGETRLPVVMIHDTYDVPSIIRGLLHGAMYCHVKPLCLDEIERLRQFCLVKEIELREESGDCLGSELSDEKAPTIEADEFSEEEYGLRGCKKRKVEKMEKDEGSSMNKSSSFVWTPDLDDRFLSAVKEFGIENAEPLKVFQRINDPGITIEAITERLQDCKAAWKLTKKLPERFLHSLASGLSHQPLNFGNVTRYNLACNFRFQSRVMDFLADPNCTRQLKQAVKQSLVRWIMGLEDPVDSSSSVQGHPLDTSALTSQGETWGPMPWTWPAPVRSELPETPPPPALSESSSYSPDTDALADFLEERVLSRAREERENERKQGERPQPPVAAPEVTPDAQEEDTACSHRK